MCGGGGRKKSAPAKKAAAVASAATPATAQASETPEKVDGAPTNATEARRRRMGKRGFKVGLDVAVANVGGSGKTGLNIPASD